MRKSGHESGLTFVELLVSISLSSMTFLAAMQLVGTSIGSSVDLAAWSNLNDKASHAMLIFEQSVARAGHLGCGGRSTTVHGLLRSELSSTPELKLSQPYAVHHFGMSTQLSNAVELPVSSSAIDSRFGINVSRLVPGNDILVVRGLGYQALPLRAQTDNGEGIEVTSRRDVGSGDFVAITDCEHVEVFRITSVSDRRDYSLLRRAAGLGRHDNQASQLASRRTFRVSPVSRPRLHKVETEFFYIATSGGAPDTSALWRKDTQRRPLEIIAGIGDLKASEIKDSDGHVLGLKVSFVARSDSEVRGQPVERAYVRHFAFENINLMEHS